MQLPERLVATSLKVTGWKSAILLLFLAIAISGFAATPVILSPIPQYYATDLAGRPLAFGCVFTYVSGTTTPLTSYTDSTGNTANPNPVILSAGGTANIWIEAGQAYTFRVKSAGGSNCAAGSTRYTVNGIGGGSSQLSTNVSASATPLFTAIAQNQLFLFTLTSNTVSLPLVVNNVQAPSHIIFQIAQNSTGSWTFAWPTNVIGGGPVHPVANSVTSQEFIWNGTNATAVGPAVYSTGDQAVQNFIAQGTLSVSGAGRVNGILTLGNALEFGSQFLDGLVTLSAHTRVATTPSGIPAGHTVCSNSNFDLVDCGSVPYFLRSSTGAAANVNANTASPQVMHVDRIPAGAINAVGKAFRVTAHVFVEPAASSVSEVLFGWGPTAALGGYYVSFDQTGSISAYDVSLTMTCVVTAPGGSGSFICAPNLLNNSAPGTSNANPFSATSVDLTGDVYLGVAAVFTSNSASNSAQNTVFLIEQLN